MILKSIAGRYIILKKENKDDTTNLVLVSFNLI